VGNFFRRTVVAASTIALLTAGFAIGATSAGAVPPLVADYQFQNSHASSIAGSPDLTDIGAGTNAFGTDDINGHVATDLSFPQDNGLSLSPTVVDFPSPDIYSVVMYFKFATTDGYRRILDFKNGTEDRGLYSLNGILDFYGDNGGSSVTITPGVYAQVVLTDAGGQVTGYVNGVQQFTFDDTSSMDATIDDNTLRFFQDNTSGGATGEDSAGSVARIRVYNGVLSASDVAGLDTISDTNPACAMGAGIPQKPPKPNKNTGLIKFSKALNETPALKPTKVTISGSLNGCEGFPTSPKAVGAATFGAVKLSLTVDVGSTCDAITPGSPPIKGTLSMSLYAPDPAHLGKFKKVSSDKTTIADFHQVPENPGIFVVTGNDFTNSKTPQYTTQHVSLFVVADQDQGTIDNACATNPKGLQSLTFTGAISPSMIEMSS
jgi:hypothetical protein